MSNDSFVVTAALIEIESSSEELNLSELLNLQRSNISLPVYFGIKETVPDFSTYLENLTANDIGQTAGTVFKDASGRDSILINLSVLDTNKDDPRIDFIIKHEAGHILFERLYPRSSLNREHFIVPVSRSKALEASYSQLDEVHADYLGFRLSDNLAENVTWVYERSELESDSYIVSDKLIERALAKAAVIAFGHEKDSYQLEDILEYYTANDQEEILRGIITSEYKKAIDTFEQQFLAN